MASSSKKNIPYAEATSGDKALNEIQKILKGFGCQSFGSMMDYENHKLIVQFRYRDTPITLEASIDGYTAMYLRRRPWTSSMRKTKQAHEAMARDQAEIAVYSILRDLIKARVTSVECGLMSFEGAFLGQIMLPSGESVLEKVTASENFLKLEKNDG